MKSWLQFVSHVESVIVWLIVQPVRTVLNPDIDVQRFIIDEPQLDD